MKIDYMSSQYKFTFESENRKTISLWLNKAKVLRFLRFSVLQMDKIVNYHGCLCILVIQISVSQPLVQVLVQGLVTFFQLWNLQDLSRPIDYRFQI
jgi:hypothetical protein